MSSKAEIHVRSHGEFSTLVNQFSDFVKEHKGRPKRNEIIRFIAEDLFGAESHHHFSANLEEDVFLFVERFSKTKAYASELGLFVCDTCKQPGRFEDGYVIWDKQKTPDSDSDTSDEGTRSRMRLIHQGYLCDQEQFLKSAPLSDFTSPSGSSKIIEKILTAQARNQAGIDSSLAEDWAVLHSRLNTPGFEEMYSTSKIDSFRQSIDTEQGVDKLSEGMFSFFGAIAVEMGDSNTKELLDIDRLEVKSYAIVPKGLSKREGFGKEYSEQVDAAITTHLAVIDLRTQVVTPDFLDDLLAYLELRQKYLKSTLILVSKGFDLTPLLRSKIKFNVTSFADAINIARKAELDRF